MDVANCELDKWWYFLYFHCQVQLRAPHTHTHTHALPPSVLTLTILTWNLAIKSTPLLHSGYCRTPSQTSLVLDVLPSAKPTPSGVTSHWVCQLQFITHSAQNSFLLHKSFTSCIPFQYKTIHFPSTVKHTPHTLRTVRM